MTIKQTLTKGMIILKRNNIDSPKLKARLLLQFILKKSRQYLIVYDNEEVGKKEQWEYFVDIEKLTQGVPLQHITHTQEFMKMDFYVDENVLIPRPDTEILVEEVIKISKKSSLYKHYFFSKKKKISLIFFLKKKSYNKIHNHNLKFLK